MDVVTKALASETPLPISILSELGKGSLRKSFRDASQDVEASQLLTLWRRLVLTATNPQVTDKHLTAASNALCVYLNGATECSVDELRAFARSPETWFEALQCSHRGFNDGKTKPAFQILETLCDLLRASSDRKMVSETVAETCLPLVRTILLASPHSEVKKACHMLSCIHRKLPILDHLGEFIRRSIEEHHFAWITRLSEHKFHPEDVSHSDDGSIQPFLLALVFTMIDLDTRSAALKLCSSLCYGNNGVTDNTNLQIMAERCIEFYLERNHTVLGDFAENVLPVVLNDRKAFTDFAYRHTHSCYNNTSSMAFFLATLKVGRLKGILSESDVLAIFNAAFPSEIPSPFDGGHSYLWFERLLTVADAEVRILTYGLLALSPNSNAIIPTGVLDCIAKCMKYLHDDADAHERSEILSVTKRFLRRLQMSGSVLHKAKSSNKCDKAVDTMLAQYISFSAEFYTFLKRELRGGLSYQRHILSLLSLQYFFDLALEPDIFMSDIELMQALVCLVLDPFEDVRSTAANLLHLLSTRSQVAVQRVLTQALLDKVDLLAVKTVRGDHADAMGRLWSLWDFSCEYSANPSESGQNVAVVTELWQYVSRLDRLVAEGKTLKPGSPYPIHGSLLAVSYRLRDFKIQKPHSPFFDATKVMGVCLKVWNQVRAHLCVDSPETASDPEDEESNEGPKDLLAYSWRALRDSSLVMQSLIIAAPPSKELYSAIGDTCMDQLISLRHRGAFSTVAQTFTLCCERVRLAKDQAVGELIKKWYKAALAQVEQQSARLTRRSAGLPAMIVALLSPTDATFFASTIFDLMDIALSPTDLSRDEVGQMKLPQVHALNCLKDIMTNSRFAVIIAQFLSRILELAATCLASRIWAIRNCGLMLLRACINRLNSTNALEADTLKAQAGDKSAEDTPATIAFRLLDSAAMDPTDTASSPNTATEHVFAALDLLGHTSLQTSKTGDTLGIISRQLSQSTWAVRDHAALLIATKIARMNPTREFKKLLEDISPNWSQNQLHGVLLCCRYMITKSKGNLAESDLYSIINTLASHLTGNKGCARTFSPYVYAAWLDILNDTAVLLLRNGWKFSIERFQEGSNSTRRSNSVHDSYFLRRCLLQKTYCYLLLKERSPDATSEEESLFVNFIANPDCLGFAVDSLSQNIPHLPCRSLALLLIELLNRGYEELSHYPDVLEQIFICLDRCLKHERDIPARLLLAVIATVELQMVVYPRELRNSALKLQASMLVAVQATQENWEIAKEAVDAWIYCVEDASTDFLDFPTRLSAASAISTYAVHLDKACSSDQFDRGRMRLLLILYELLNDDDEEVRLEAIEAARKLKLHELEALDNLGISALSARRQLVVELQRRYGSTFDLTEAALVKILQVGINHTSAVNLQGLASYLQISVQAKLSSIAKAKSDLFAEEKQNLYIDDLREIGSWIELVGHGGYRLLPQVLSSAIMKWTLEGLDQVFHILEAEKGSKHLQGPLKQGVEQEDSSRRNLVSNINFWHPLGATYDHEVLVVVVKVVSLAGLVLHHEKTVDLLPLKDKLEELHTICLDSQVNRVVIDAVSNALTG